MPRRFTFALFGLALLCPPAGAAEPPLSTVVLFDAVCLTCHEGECSGRMALRTERSGDGLSGHVASYAGPQDDGVVSQLKALMGGLKTRCRLPPLPMAAPADGIWTSAGLARVSLPDHRRVFLPLGRPSPAAQALRLGLAEPQRLRVQVVADNFDIVMDQEAEVGPAGTVLGWTPDEPGEYFLRLLARQPMTGLSVGR